MVAMHHISFVITKLFFLITGSRITRRDDWSVVTEVHYVVAANHVFWFDPFMATTALGWKRLRPLLPCRFIAAPKFLQRSYLRTMMRWLGAYPSHGFRDWPYGLDASIELHRQGQTVVIFPQGKMTYDEHLPAKRGVRVLAQLPHTLIIPVNITRKRSKLPSFVITVGEPFMAAKLDENEIMDRIYQLKLS